MLPAGDGCREERAKLKRKVRGARCSAAEPQAALAHTPHGKTRGWSVFSRVFGNRMSLCIQRMHTTSFIKTWICTWPRMCLCTLRARSCLAHERCLTRPRQLHDSGPNPEALPVLIEIFQTIDTDHSGLITREEVSHVPIDILPPRVLEAVCVDNMEACGSNRCFVSCWLCIEGAMIMTAHVCIYIYVCLFVYMYVCVSQAFSLYITYSYTYTHAHICACTSTY